jgi:general secretion pathway protein K
VSAEASRRGGQDGFALLIVLWTMVLLALLGTELLSSSRSETQLAGNLRSAAVLQAATDGAVQQAIFHLLQPSPQRWIADDRAYVIRLGRATVTVRLQDENGKIDLNTAPEPLLAALLRQVGVDPATAASLAAAIADWRSGGFAPRQLGAKAPAYAAAGRPYGPPGADFRTVGELGSVLGMTPALMARLRPHVTVYSDDGPNGASYDPVVTAALGNPPRTVVDPNAAPDVVTVIADARDATGARFGEQAVVRLNAQYARFPYQLLSLCSRK